MMWFTLVLAVAVATDETALLQSQTSKPAYNICIDFGSSGAKTFLCNDLLNMKQACKIFADPSGNVCGPDSDGNLDRGHKSKIGKSFGTFTDKTVKEMGDEIMAHLAKFRRRDIGDDAFEDRGRPGTKLVDGKVALKICKATAGNRFSSPRMGKKANKDGWKKWEEALDSIKLSYEGPGKCKTIPGTQEAFLEFNIQEIRDTGIGGADWYAGIGGASMQIKLGKMNMPKVLGACSWVPKFPKEIYKDGAGAESITDFCKAHPGDTGVNAEPGKMAGVYISWLSDRCMYHDPTQRRNTPNWGVAGGWDESLHKIGQELFAPSVDVRTPNQAQIDLESAQNNGPTSSAFYGEFQGLRLIFEGFASDDTFDKLKMDYGKVAKVFNGWTDVTLMNDPMWKKFVEYLYGTEKGLLRKGVAFLLSNFAMGSKMSVGGHRGTGVPQEIQKFQDLRTKASNAARAARACFDAITGDVPRTDCATKLDNAGRTTIYYDAKLSAIAFKLDGKVHGDVARHEAMFAPFVYTSVGGYCSQTRLNEPGTYANINAAFYREELAKASTKESKCASKKSAFKGFNPNNLGRSSWACGSAIYGLMLYSTLSGYFGPNNRNDEDFLNNMETLSTAQTSVKRDWMSGHAKLTNDGNADKQDWHEKYG